jgi:hypothetical protein
MGCRRANATYFVSHGVDETTEMSYGMNMTPLMNDANIKPSEFVREFIQHFAEDVKGRVSGMGE